MTPRQEFVSSSGSSPKSRVRDSPLFMGLGQPTRFPLDSSLRFQNKKVHIQKALDGRRSF